MTHPRPSRSSGQVPVLRDEWREPLRAQRDPLGQAAGRARVDRDRPRQWRKQSWLGRFVSTYGWRAYALPVLMVLTVVVGYQTVTGTTSPKPAAAEAVHDTPDIGSVGTSIIDTPPRGLAAFDANLPAGTLPAGGPYTQAGDKTWRVVPGTTPQVGQGTGKVFRYTVEVENGLDPTMYGGDDAFAQMIDQTLANPKGWTHDPQFAFMRIDSGKPDFRISLVSPVTVREGCGYEFPLETSCYNPSYGPDRQARVFINEARWVRGAVPFEGDIGSYRQYVINHEVGHAIGYLRHEACEKPGGLAPVMMQQTFSTSDDEAAPFDPEFVKADGKTCHFNPWPYPIA
ncbi:MULTISPECIES: DUF3152 domain-containing protein [Mycobacterium ulcerans group]|uniref:DUF3152 domain-containing protein n=1 Tax=Mycobacterium ulcerans group TaxID=2993898 RepID=UPI000358A62A|nr:MULTISPECIES: DUF3152 domain-containing protein [Mycobacterium ulcerans group]EPQ70564.1 hypothetical protein MMEU_5003 [Mycobacterium marinum str. Europe]WCS19536.1 DUF3152 domain-containing protein [Mycobacterium marinum]WOR05864.1 DUF3152 domain-containing protein [Mycobacterium marinum]CDM75466.1 conserved hypothetical protein [Mycobacterium marinum E11]